MEARKQGRARGWNPGDEPAPGGDGWEEYGGELMWVVGHTDGGAPFGLTVDEFRLANERVAGAAGWARARFVLKELLERSSEPATRAEVGWVRRIGHGISRDVFAAEVELTPDPCHRSGPCVVLLPPHGANAGSHERVRRELRLLARLADSKLAFRLPNCAGAYPVSGGLALVQRFLPGVELDLRAGRQPGVRPWETLGELMAAIHRVGRDRFDDLLPGCGTRREHALEALRVFDGLEGAEVRAARAWAEAHLPAAEPSVLLHGDLLGQNILLAPGGPPAVIDWERARRGDPAYDLAIVTRGHKRPFQTERGLDRLLEAYHGHGGARVTPEHVALHEMCLVAGGYVESLAGRGAHPPHEELARLAGLLRRVDHHGG